MIICVCHHKGGVCKTTTAFNLSFALPTDLVIDGDILKGFSILTKFRQSDLPYELAAFDQVKPLIARLKKAKEAGQNVIIDCGGFDSAITRAAIAVADLLLVPVSDTPTERNGLIGFDQTLAAISGDIGHELKAHLLISRVNPLKKNFEKIDSLIPRLGHVERLNTIISSRPDHYLPHEFGEGVTEKLATRHTAAGKEIIALAEEIQRLAA